MLREAMRNGNDDTIMEWLPHWFGWSSFGWTVGVFLLTFTISLAVVGALIVLLPARFFLDSHDRQLWVDRHPAVRWLGVFAKNLLGVLLILVGLGLSLPGIPGQGLLTILMGVILLDFPGKRRLERTIVGRPRVSKTVNRLRLWFHRPAFVLHEDQNQEGEPQASVLK